MLCIMFETWMNRLRYHVYPPFNLPSVMSEDAARKVVCFHIRGAGCSHVPIMGVSLSKPLTNILATIGVSKRSHEHGPLRRRQSRRRPKEEDGLDPWVSYDVCLMAYFPIWDNGGMELPKNVWCDDGA
ncbi:hypothetical protein BDV39DRAFT_175403 [Aspergillus sergii]|uniref:Uncharacterized protein n=1 Tax=Aspergillus sergii TaxID=1034303 RepID=A0A5N6X6Z2_9EURO|nr:hypothetical protein BDV39DRAFT_175403 [Aspergillus sergii]